jgi:hypothetical protein
LPLAAFACIVTLSSDLFPAATSTGLTLRMPHTEFRNGYVAGWQSIKGREPTPAFPMFHVPDGETPYRAGIALGVRDAVASIAKRAGARGIDDWFENALRRPLSP